MPLDEVVVSGPHAPARLLSYQGAALACTTADLAVSARLRRRRGGVGGRTA